MVNFQFYFHSVRKASLESISTMEATRKPR